MTKDKKEGITLIILAVTIIVALALLSTIIISYDSIKNSMKKREFAKEIYTIQKLSDEYFFKNSELAIGNDYNLDFNGKDTDYIYQFEGEESQSNVYTGFYELDLYKIGVENVARGAKADGDLSDIYVISKKTRKVYYAKGVLIDGYTYYTLTPELKKMLE